MTFELAPANQRDAKQSEATSAAIGKKISPKVLRQTCGDLHTRNGDGSVLTTLGWSPCFAFHYTWLPREIVGSTDNSSSTYVFGLVIALPIILWLCKRACGIGCWMLA